MEGTIARQAITMEIEMGTLARQTITMEIEMGTLARQTITMEIEMGTLARQTITMEIEMGTLARQTITMEIEMGTCKTGHHHGDRDGDLSRTGHHHGDRDGDLSKANKHIHESQHTVAASNKERDLSIDAVVVQGPDNLKELTDIFHGVLSDKVSEKMVKPYHDMNDKEESRGASIGTQDPTSEQENMTGRGHHSKPFKHPHQVITTSDTTIITSSAEPLEDSAPMDGHDSAPMDGHDSAPMDGHDVQSNHSPLQRWGSMEGLDHIKEAWPGHTERESNDVDACSVASDDTFVVKDDLAQSSQGGLAMIPERKLSSEIHRRMAQLGDSKPEGPPITKPLAGSDVVINGNVSHMLKMFRGIGKSGEEVKHDLSVTKENMETNVETYEGTIELTTFAPSLARTQSLEVIAESEDEDEEEKRQVMDTRGTQPSPGPTNSSTVTRGPISPDEKDSPTPPKQRRSLSSTSPLTISQSASNVKREIATPTATPTAPPIAAPLPPLQTRRGSDGSPRYMTPANLPHLNKLLEDHHEKMVAMAQVAVERLIKEAMSSRKIPRVFREIRHGPSCDQLFVWKLKVCTFCKVFIITRGGGGGGGGAGKAINKTFHRRF